MLTLLDAPWFGGEPYSSPAAPDRYLSDDAGDLEMPAPHTILLDGHQYAVETREYRHMSRRTLRDSTAIAGEATDSLFDTQGQWMRYRHSWHLGAGQQLDDLGDDQADPFRYLIGENIDPWTNGRLARRVGWEDVSPSFSAGSASGGGAMCSAGQTVVVSDGTETFIDIQPYSSWTTVTGLAGDVQTITTDGVTFYIGTSSGLYTLPAAGTAATSLSAGNVDHVAFAANRLIIGNAHELYEVSAAGTRTLIREHFQTSFRWNGIWSIGSRIYVAGYAGQRSEIYSLTTDETGALLLAAEAAPLETNEVLLGAVAYAGFAMLSTTNGIRFAQVGADGTLTYGPAIVAQRRTAGTFTPSGSVAVGGGFAWAAADIAGRGGLVELNLGTFVDTLQPAHVLVGVDTNFVPGLIVYVGSSSDRRYVLGYDAFENSVKRIGAEGQSEDDTYNGYVRTGIIRFGTVEEKVLVDLELGFDDLPADALVQVQLLDEDGALINPPGADGESTENATSLLFDLQNTVVRGCAIGLELVAYTAGVVPVIRYWRMRGYPVVPPVQEWIVPLIAHETVLVGSGEQIEQAQDPLVIRNRIEALWAGKTPTTYTEGEVDYTVRVEDFEIRPSKWTSDGEYFQSLIFVKLVAV